MRGVRESRIMIIMCSILPRSDLKTFDFAEMGVARNQGQIVLTRNRRNPNIIFGYRMTFNPQRILDRTIMARSFNSTSQHNATGYKFINAFQIFFYSPRFLRAKIQLLNRNARNKELDCSDEMILDRRIIREKGYDNIGVQKIFTTHGCPPVRNHLQLLDALVASRLAELRRQTGLIANRGHRVGQTLQARV